MTWTSQCVDVDAGPFHLVGVGSQHTGEIDITLGAYDPANLRYTATQVGTVVGPNNAVYDINEEMSFVFDLGTGDWILEGGFIEKVPIGPC